MAVCEENSYRLFHQSLAKVKQQLNPTALQLICRQLTERPGEDNINQERLALIIHQQFGDCSLVVLIFILTLLTMSNHEAFNAYQQVFNDGDKDITPYPRKREEELEEQLIDVQKKFAKLQKENEQVSAIQGSLKRMSNFVGI